MGDMFERTRLLTGDRGIQTLQQSRVVLFGVGGVGSFAAEALARAGVGFIRLVDFDVVQESNLNRQLVALRSTIGRHKTVVMQQRIADIHPGIQVNVFSEHYRPEHLQIEGEFDYCIDAIDMVSAKVDLISRAMERGLPVISSMGAGNKLDNTRFQVTDISRTHTCPLAKVVRRELRNRGIAKGVTVVYSEAPVVEHRDNPELEQGRPPVGSISFVPGTAGLILAGQVINDLLSRGMEDKEKTNGYTK